MAHVSSMLFRLTTDQLRKFAEFDTSSSIYKYGRNNNVDATVNTVDVCHGLTSTYAGFPTYGSPETIEVFSSSVNDTHTTGTGAWDLTIQGLDTNLEPIEASVNLNGTTPVVVPTLLWERVNRAFISNAGALATNDGTITCRHTTTTANVFFEIPQAFGQTIVAAWTCPADHHAVLEQAVFAVARSSAQVREIEMGFGLRKANTTAWRLLTPVYLQTTNPPFPFPAAMATPVRLEAGDDIVVRCFNATASALGVTATMELLIAPVNIN